ncbi:hypothetical protein FA13DRAFT_774100 [Coprinellus micaceus]|uniref:Uncharacterized protein n=1 Tax=Coprinellus micaceus TaxID=71717 RepID=A0A4Y7T3S8_COPMI|nr:hypothetical protein FA13DRAFT_774100 [Coprinellus micaceus]
MMTLPLGERHQIHVKILNATGAAYAKARTARRGSPSRPRRSSTDPVKKTSPPPPPPTRAPVVSSRTVPSSRPLTLHSSPSIPQGVQCYDAGYSGVSMGLAWIQHPD